MEEEVTPLSLLAEEPLVPFCGLFLFNATIAYVSDMKSPNQDISRKRRANIGYNWSNHDELIYFNLGY